MGERGQDNMHFRLEAGPKELIVGQFGPTPYTLHPTPYTLHSTP